MLHEHKKHDYRTRHPELCLLGPHEYNLIHWNSATAQHWWGTLRSTAVRLGVAQLLKSGIFFRISPRPTYGGEMVSGLAWEGKASCKDYWKRLRPGRVRALMSQWQYKQRGPTLWAVGQQNIHTELTQGQLYSVPPPQKKEKRRGEDKIFQLYHTGPSFYFMSWRQARKSVSTCPSYFVHLTTLYESSI